MMTGAGRGVESVDPKRRGVRVRGHAAARASRLPGPFARVLGGPPVPTAVAPIVTQHAQSSTPTAALYCVVGAVIGPSQQDLGQVILVVNGEVVVFGVPEAIQPRKISQPGKVLALPAVG